MSNFDDCPLFFEDDPVNPKACEGCEYQDTCFPKEPGNESGDDMPAVEQCEYCGAESVTYPTDRGELCSVCLKEYMDATSVH